MKTHKRRYRLLRFVALIPQCDLLTSFREYQRRLFAASFTGAFSFPAIAPLARVLTPFTSGELKSLAIELRRLSMHTGGAIQSSGTALDHICTEELNFLGIQLSIGTAAEDGKQGNEGLFPETAKRKMLEVFSPPALCAAIVPSHKVHPCIHDLHKDAQEFPSAPAFSFRSAAVSNFTVRPLPSGDPAYSFEWRIDPLVWLPSWKGALHRGASLS